MIHYRLDVLSYAQLYLVVPLLPKLAFTTSRRYHFRSLLCLARLSYAELALAMRNANELFLAIQKTRDREANGWSFDVNGVCADSAVHQIAM